jgi:hypothetical protein
LTADPVPLARDDAMNLSETPSPQAMWPKPPLKTSLKEDNKEQTQSSAKEYDSPQLTPPVTCMRDLEIRLGINQCASGRECNLTIIVPQGFDELTLHRLLAVAAS